MYVCRVFILTGSQHNFLQTIRILLALYNLHSEILVGECKEQLTLRASGCAKYTVAPINKGR